MKVLMQGKVDLFESGGGDKVQIENTARELKKLGVEVDIIPGFKADYQKYDLVHLFQLDWTPETYLYARGAKIAKKPLVLSPIHHSVKELKRFDDEYVFDFRRVSKLLFKDQYKRDTLKNIYKSFFDFRKIKPTVISIFLGLKNMEKTTLEISDYVLVQTELEAQDIEETFDVKIKWKKIPNGVPEMFLNVNPEDLEDNPVGMEDYIIVVGRVEARKNHLSIIEAVENFRKKHNIDVGLVVVGWKSSKKHIEYIHKFEKKMKEHSWIKFIENVPHEKMPLYFSHAKVCVSASWFETTGLTSLEALFCGTNAVAAGSRAKEFLGDNVSYCEPSDVLSIQKAISKEYYAPRPNISDLSLKEYTWENAAKKTLDVYNELLAK